MDSRVSQLEEKITLMEVGIKKSIDTSMEELFKKYLNKPSTPTRDDNKKRKAL